MNFTKISWCLGNTLYGLKFYWILLGVWECGIQEIRTFYPYGIIVDRKKIKTKVYFLIYIIVHFVTIMNYVKTIDYGQMRYQSEIISVYSSIQGWSGPNLYGAETHC